VGERGKIKLKDSEFNDFFGFDEIPGFYNDEINSIL